MTSNELILLLDCYRGFNKRNHSRELAHNLKTLKFFIKKGDKFKYELTPAGWTFVRKILDYAYDIS